MLFVDLGTIGSPVDVATFILVLAELIHRIRPKVQTLAAAVVALAEGRDDVDDDRLADELDVQEREVDAVRTTIVRTDGGDEADA